jgi:hypothetical protein
MNSLWGLRLPYEHLTGWNKPADDVHLGVVLMKCLAVHFAIHLRVGQEGLRWTTLGHYRQHPRLLKLFDGLCGKDHRRFVLAPGLLRLRHVIADRLALDKQPCLIEQEDVEGGELLRVGNFIRGAMQDVKQQRLQDLRCIIPTVEVERLKARKRKRVLGVVKEEPVLSTTRPAVQAVL